MEETWCNCNECNIGEVEEENKQAKTDDDSSNHSCARQGNSETIQYVGHKGAEKFDFQDKDDQFPLNNESEQGNLIEGTTTEPVDEPQLKR